MYRTLGNVGIFPRTKSSTEAGATGYDEEDINLELAHFHANVSTAFQRRALTRQIHIYDVELIRISSELVCVIQRLAMPAFASLLEVHHGRDGAQQQRAIYVPSSATAD